MFSYLFNLYGNGNEDEVRKPVQARKSKWSVSDRWFVLIQLHTLDIKKINMGFSDDSLRYQAKKFGKLTPNHIQSVSICVVFHLNF